jgi:ABC-type phosphate transport system substrate-binding protein
MSSPGIDEWIDRAPESWAKLAEKSTSKISYASWKKKFFEGAEKENKAYLKKYLTEEQLKKIFTEGAGGKIKSGGSPPIQKPTTIKVKRNNKEYTRQNTSKWVLQTQYVLKLAAEAKPRSADYKKYRDILIAQGRTRQAVTKKIQRTRKVMK